MVHQNTKKTKKFQNIKSSVFKLQASSIFFATLNYNSESWCDICKDFTNTINVEVDRDKDQIMVARKPMRNHKAFKYWTPSIIKYTQFNSRLMTNIWQGRN